MNIGEIARNLENFGVDKGNIGNCGRLRLNQLSITKKNHIVSISLSDPGPIIVFACHSLANSRPFGIDVRKLT